MAPPPLPAGLTEPRAAPVRPTPPAAAPAPRPGPEPPVVAGARPGWPIFGRLMLTLGGKAALAWLSRSLRRCMTCCAAWSCGLLPNQLSIVPIIPLLGAVQFL